MGFPERLLRMYAWVHGRIFRARVPKSKEWDSYRTLSMDAFDFKLNTFPYKSDPLHGLVDYTASFSHFVKGSVLHGRDCDDFARMWTLWGISNGFTAVEVLVSTSSHLFSNAHAVTLLDDGKCNVWLCNYHKSGTFGSRDGALDAIKSWSCYADGYIHAVSGTYSPV